jgi:hypothetical protein
MNEKDFARRALKRLRKNANQLQLTYSNDKDIAQDAQDIFCACDVLQSNFQDVWTGLVVKDAADKVGALASRLEAVMRKHRLHFLARNSYVRGLLVCLNTYNPSACPAEVSCELKSTAVMLQLMSTAADLPEIVSPELPEVPESVSPELPQISALRTSPALRLYSMQPLRSMELPSPPYHDPTQYGEIVHCLGQMPAGNREPELTDNLGAEYEKKGGN